MRANKPTTPRIAPLAPTAGDMSLLANLTMTLKYEDTTPVERYSASVLSGPSGPISAGSSDHSASMLSPMWKPVLCENVERRSVSALLLYGALQNQRSRNVPPPPKPVLAARFHARKTVALARMTDWGGVEWGVRGER